MNKLSMFLGNGDMDVKNGDAQIDIHTVYPS